LWFCGLSGSGKTTISMALQQQLVQEGYEVVVFDGDVVRKGISKDLGFSPEDRTENIFRVAQACKNVSQRGVLAISATISPYESHRVMAGEMLGDTMKCIYLDASLQVCQDRDVKGLYAKAMAGEITNFTGVSDIFEPPQHPDLVLHTGQDSVEVCVRKLYQFLCRDVLGTTP